MAIFFDLKSNKPGHRFRGTPQFLPGKEMFPEMREEHNSYHLGYRPDLPNDDHPEFTNPQFPVYGQDWDYYLSQTTTKRNFSGKGPKNYTLTDKRIEEIIGETFTWDPALDASQIEVIVHNGLVTLRGKVRGRLAKYHAEDLVFSMPGVRDLHNELQIDPFFMRNS